MVCRVFQKSSAMKKPPSSPPSLPQLVESSCDTTLMTELEEIDMPNLHSLVSFSSGFSSVSTNNNIISGDNNNNHIRNINNGSSSNNNISMINNDMNMNWDLANGATNHPSLNWPSGLLNNNFSTNSSSILKALQFACQPQEGSSLSSLIAQGECLQTNLNSNFASSSSKGTNSIQQQPFHLDSIWRSC